MPVIELQNVTKALKKNDVIADVSLSVEAGTVVGLRGINGSGKTMLLRLIAGLIRPDKGTVQINHTKVKSGLDFPESIGLLIENPAFLDSYNGFDNLKLLASIRDIISDAQIEETLSDVGLGQAGKKKYKKYSLGMKQRLGIAAAVMEHPDLILLDEPTNALDDDGIDMVGRIVRREKERGATILVACHDKEILTQMADQIVYMDSGKIVRTESVGQVR